MWPAGSGDVQGGRGTGCRGRLLGTGYLADGPHGEGRVVGARYLADGLHTERQQSAVAIVQGATERRRAHEVSVQAGDGVGGRHRGQGRGELI